MLKDYRIGPLAGGDPKHIVIFLHGFGDSGSGGMLSLGEAWRGDLQDCEFLCPDAPFPFDQAPPEFGGRQWFPLDDMSPSAMLAGTERAAPFLDKYIDHVLATRKLPADKLALVGFSQGTMMALHVGLRRKEAVACIVGYSGLMIAGGALRTEKKSSPPVLLLHGKMDEVVPFAAMEETERNLRAAGIAVETKTLPLTGHTIDQVGVIEGLRFIRKAWSS